MSAAPPPGQSYRLGSAVRAAANLGFTVALPDPRPNERRLRNDPQVSALGQDLRAGTREHSRRLAAGCYSANVDAIVFKYVSP